MPKMIVTARPNAGFRRAGRLWPATPTTVVVDDKTAKVLRAEPMLSVVDVQEEPQSSGSHSPQAARK